MNLTEDERKPLRRATAATRPEPGATASPRTTTGATRCRRMLEEHRVDRYGERAQIGKRAAEAEAAEGARGRGRAPATGRGHLPQREPPRGTLRTADRRPATTAPCLAQRPGRHRALRVRSARTPARRGGAGGGARRRCESLGFRVASSWSRRSEPACGRARSTQLAPHRSSAPRSRGAARARASAPSSSKRRRASERRAERLTDALDRTRTPQRGARC